MVDAADRRHVTIASLLFASIVLLLAQGATNAQTRPGVVGDWSGTLKAGGSSLRLALHVTADSAGKLAVSLDSLDQGAFGLAGSNVVLSDRDFSFDIPSVSGRYKGTLSPDGKMIGGTWSQGAELPLEFTREAGTPAKKPEPTPTPVAAASPVALDQLKAALDRELAPVLQHGLLSASSGGGIVIGVLDHGKRRIFSYGTAHPDSIFEIGSITKTFTGLALAQMVVQKKVALDDPVRTLLPAGAVAQPSGPEITLLDLATQHSGLPRMPDNFWPEDPSNPYRDYDWPQLHEFLSKHGVAKPADSKFLYSNLGFGLLGYALSQRAGVSYEQLVKNEITGPLHLDDTVVTLSPTQRERLIQGHNDKFDPAPPWDFDVLAGAGALRSTAADLLTYLDANMHPEKYATGAKPSSPAATLPAAIAIDHLPRADAAPDAKIALAWLINLKNHSLNHNGGTGGYSALVGFSSDHDLAIAVLYNRDDAGVASPMFVTRVAENIAQIMSGKPSIPLDYMTEVEHSNLTHRTFSVSSIRGPYHCRVAAMTLPDSVDAPFTTTGTGDIHAIADGKGKLVSGTWVHTINAPNLKMTCKLKLMSGSYSVKADGTGSEDTKWQLVTGESPRECFQFFPPVHPVVAIDSQLITMDKGGRIFYSTSINPFWVLTGICERESKQ